MVPTGDGRGLLQVLGAGTVRVEPSRPRSRVDYFCSVIRDQPIRPSDHLPAVGILAEEGDYRSQVGIGYPYTHVGGMQATGNPWADYPPPEVVWRLVIDRA